MFRGLKGGLRIFDVIVLGVGVMVMDAPRECHLEDAQRRYEHALSAVMLMHAAACCGSKVLRSLQNRLCPEFEWCSCS
jgi:hypothetical protein